MAVLGYPRDEGNEPLSKATSTEKVPDLMRLSGLPAEAVVDLEEIPEMFDQPLPDQNVRPVLFEGPFGDA